ncbi:hypothetical protein AVEN_15561-1 [Araneus ventricosus]|uniref:Uncharacterized protein n=1 Tax=Araneus ventricosus TaxID=182803 RepID=A0A4Y2FT74_ARAVE|nr:hypothetical protein AVEN_15561-1 [Araneus ventricosus]
MGSPLRGEGQRLTTSKNEIYHNNGPHDMPPRAIISKKRANRLTVPNLLNEQQSGRFPSNFGQHPSMGSLYVRVKFSSVVSEIRFSKERANLGGIASYLRMSYLLPHPLPPALFFSSKRNDENHELAIARMEEGDESIVCGGCSELHSRNWKECRERSPRGEDEGVMCCPVIGWVDKSEQA